MSLTEEQKRALKRVVAYMDEMYAIASPYYGCTEDANILQAMIDSSDHIVEPDELIGFDLEKARAVDIDLLAATDWGELRRHHCAALDEIERLRGYEIAARDLSADLTKVAGDRDEQAARIKELEANCIYDPETGKVFVPDGHPELEKLRARNRDLEDAHKRSGARYAKIINELRSSVYANTPGLKKQWDEILNAPANGKIGSDADAKPQVWQITDERVEALNAMGNLHEAIICPKCGAWIGFAGIQPYMMVLRAMLTEADHDKP